MLCKSNPGGMNTTTPVLPTSQLLQHVLQPQIGIPIAVFCRSEQGRVTIAIYHAAKTPAVTEQIIAAVERSLPEILRHQQGDNFSGALVGLQLWYEEQLQPYKTRLLYVEPSSVAPNLALPDASALVYADRPLSAEQDLAELSEPEQPIHGIEVSSRRAIKRPATIAASVGGALLLAVWLYAITRPCVVGQCRLLDTAQQIDQTLSATLQPTASAAAVLDAQRQLLETKRRVQAIPYWSRHSNQAQQVSRQLDQRLAALETVVEALQLGQIAAENGKNLPHSIEHWQEVEAQWRSALALLQSTPTDSFVNRLVQHKRAEYAANLQAITQRVHSERTAETELNAVRSAARLAETRTRLAETIEDWQLVEATWRAAIAALERISSNTAAHVQADVLMDLYPTRLTQASNRLTQEKIAQTTYNQAIDFAAQARRAEQANQWSEAVFHWQDAVTYAQQVPKGTLSHPPAQALLSTYRPASTTAQDRLRIAVMLQRAPFSLDRLCAGTPPVCSPTLTRNAIQLHFTSPLDRTIAALMIHTLPTPSTATDAIDRATRLLQQVATLSQQVQTPIELYDSTGDRVGQYDPKLSGYVQE